MDYISDLKSKDLIHPPKWMICNTPYQVMMGSQAYGVNNEDSDMDIYGFCIPPKDVIFPHLSGYIEGFGSKREVFNQWQETHILDKSRQKEYDFSIYNIVRYFQLCMENNPNMIDSIFVPRHCILHITELGEHVRSNRQMFLHKGSWHKFRGYAYAQLSKIDSGTNKANPKRQADIEKYGYSTKFAYHIVRLINEVEQILINHDIDLLRDREVLKSIRRGEWSLDDIKDWFKNKETDLNNVYLNSKLREYPDEQSIKTLLLECLEMHFGTLENAIKVDKNYEKLGREIRNILENFNI